jgi:hypothetical protein
VEGSTAPRRPLSRLVCRHYHHGALRTTCRARPSVDSVRGVEGDACPMCDTYSSSLMGRWVYIPVSSNGVEIAPLRRATAACEHATYCSAYVDALRQPTGEARRMEVVTHVTCMLLGLQHALSPRVGAFRPMSGGSDMRSSNLCGLLVDTSRRHARRRCDDTGRGARRWTAGRPRAASPRAHAVRRHHRVGTMPHPRRPVAR